MSSVLELISASGAMLSGIGTLVSCGIALYVYRASKKPKLSLDYEIIRSEEDNLRFDREVYYTEEEYYNGKHGFNRTGQSFNIYLEIKNISDVPIENLSIEYEIEIFTVELKFKGSDKSDFEVVGTRYYKTILKEMNKDYLPPNKKLRDYILATGVIYKCKINIKNVKYGNKFIKSRMYKKKFTLVTFDVKNLIDLGDSVESKRMVGVLGENDCREEIAIDWEESLD
ncbi:MAG: hypothetical protein ACRC28_00875 [Clostridium sp.]|uniref:hypothetical protein n=1 Tax=Clostridia TaxID=186801 RepID=UPI003F35B951